MAAAEIRVEVVIALGPHRVERRRLRLPDGATAGDAVRASGLIDDGDPAAIHLGCWGRLCSPGTTLRDLDRVELYRPLPVDPMEARRRRQRRDGPKAKPKPDAR